MPRAILDENISLRVTEPLHRLGYEVLAIAHQAAHGMPDEAVFALATEPQGLLITRDTHFTNPLRFPLGKIPTTRLIANAVHFELTLLAYDLVNWFRRLCLPGLWKTARLQTLRYELFLLPARLLCVKHRNVLKLPQGYPHRKQFTTALRHIRTLRLP